MLAALKGPIEQAENWVNKRLFGADERIRLYRKLARQLANTVRLQDAIQEMSVVSAELNPTSTFAVLYRNLLPIIQDGRPFSEALTGWVPGSDLMIIRSGERSGKLSESLEQLAATIEAGKEMKGAIVSAVAYPIVLLVLTIGLVIYIAGYAVPVFTNALQGRVHFTGAAQALYWLSGVVLSWKIFAIIGSTIAFFVLIIGSLPRWAGWGRARADKMPPWSIYRLMLGSGFLLSLGSLMASGRRLKDALYDLMEDANPWLSSRIGAILIYVEEGRNLADSMQQTGHKFPDEDIIEDLYVYSKLASFEEVLTRIGLDWVRDGIRTVKKQAAVLNLLAMLIMGIGVAFITLGMMDMADQASQAIGH